MLTYAFGVQCDLQIFSTQKQQAHMHKRIIFLLITLVYFLVLSNSICFANNSDQNANTNDEKLLKLKSKMQQTKFLPEANGRGGDDSYFGYSLSIDGNTALIGAPDSGHSGAAYVFDFDGEQWNKTATLEAVDQDINANFGVSVSLSGNRALIGAEYDLSSGERTGSAYVYDFDGANWIQSQKLTGTDNERIKNFGNSVSINGNRLFVGAYASGEVYNVHEPNPHGAGAIFIFENSGTQWLQSQKIVANDDHDIIGFGRTFSIFGERLLVGASWGENDTPQQFGAAYVFDYDGQTWQQSYKIISNNLVVGDKFGVSVSLGPDRALIGAYRDSELSSYAGAAYIFDFDGLNWNQTQKLTADGSVLQRNFGRVVNLSGNQAMVSISYGRSGSVNETVYVFKYNGSTWQQAQKIVPSDGDTPKSYASSIALTNEHVLVGAFTDNEFDEAAGSVYVYQKQEELWTQRQKLAGDDGAAKDYFGGRVSIDGNFALISATGDDILGSSSGAVYVYEYDGKNWILNQKLFADDGQAGNIFGASVSLDGHRALIGAPGDYLSEDSGAAYIFDYADGVWNQTQKLTKKNLSGNNRFGNSVSLKNNQALIGSPGEDELYSDTGSAYVFNFDGLNWYQAHKLNPAESFPGHNFGNRVHLSNDRLLIGTHPYDGTVVEYVYVFDFDGNNWVETQRLAAPDEPNYALNRFGSSLSLYDNLALIGAYGDDELGDDAGAAYIFELDSMNWVQTQKLTASDGRVNDYFGISASLTDNIAIIGAHGANDTGSGAGAVYVYKFDGTEWQQIQKRFPTDRNDNNFGTDIDLNGDIALIGAPWDHNQGAYSGSAYIIDITDEYNDLIFRNGMDN